MPPRLKRLAVDDQFDQGDNVGVSGASAVDDDG